DRHIVAVDRLDAVMVEVVNGVAVRISADQGEVAVVDMDAVAGSASTGRAAVNFVVEDLQASRRRHHDAVIGVGDVVRVNRREAGVTRYVDAGGEIVDIVTVIAGEVAIADRDVLAGINVDTEVALSWEIARAVGVDLVAIDVQRINARTVNAVRDVLDGV